MNEMMIKGCGKEYIYYAIFYEENQMDAYGRGIGEPQKHNWGKQICGNMGLCDECKELQKLKEKK